MGRQIRHITKFVLALLFSVVLSACGGGGGDGGGGQQSAPYKAIDNLTLFNVLKDGSPEQSFPGVSSFIDTSVVFQGADMFLGLQMDSDVKSLITKNVNSYLEATSPVFDAGPTPPYAGVAVDASLKKITVALPDITVSWTFAANSVVRSYAETRSTGDFKGSAYLSTWNYTYNAVTGLTTAVFTDSIDETTSNNTQTQKASHNGTVVYKRNSADSSLTNLSSANFSQIYTETNNGIPRTYTMNGNVKMTGVTATAGNLTFDGDFSFTLPSYQTVAGLVTLANGTYGKGFDSANNAYFNETNISSGTLTLTSQTDYSSYTPVVNAVSLRGAWLGTFDDSCSTTGAGRLELSITETTATWFGSSADSSRIYGTLITIDGSGLHLKDNSLNWGDSNEVTDSSIKGTWSSGGCGGTFSIVKQP